MTTITIKNYDFFRKVEKAISKKLNALNIAFESTYSFSYDAKFEYFDKLTQKITDDIFKKAFYEKGKIREDILKDLWIFNFEDELEIANIIHDNKTFILTIKKDESLILECK